MFPITKDFVDHEHLIDVKSLIFSDVDRIYEIMKNELKK